MKLFALIAVLGSIVALVQAGGGDTTTQPPPSACTDVECPRGSICKVCQGPVNDTAYCDKSCSIDNGGCPAGTTCKDDGIVCPQGDYCCRQLVECEERCTIPCMDGVFVLDISKSIADDEHFNLMKDFVTSTFPVVNISAECSRAAVILFARDATIRFDLNEYTDVTSLTNAVNEIVYSEIDEHTRTGTNTPAALDLLRIAGLDGRLGLRDGFVHIGVVITDGKPYLNHYGISKTGARERTETAGNRLHEAEIYDQIYAIGIEGKNGLGNTLGYIADPEELVFPIAGFDDELFAELRRNISRTFCNPCLLRECPPGTICRICEETGEAYCEYSCAVDNGGCPEGVRCTEVEVPTCDPSQCCSHVNVTCSACNLDIVDCVFVLDNSVSIKNDTNFGLIRNMVVQIVEQLNIGPDNTLVSLMIFARHAWINFPITQYTNADDLIDAINQISYYDTPELNRTGTNIPEALDLLREGGQDGRIGLRGNANFTTAIFITDGRANNIDLVEEQTGEDLKGDARKNQKAQDEANAVAAAERLHESGVYDEVFAVGIEGSHKINEYELKAIASDPAFVFKIEDFSRAAFQAVIFQINEELCDACTGVTCPRGSSCKVCHEVLPGTPPVPYCEESCSIDNGGCPAGSKCKESVVCPQGGYCCRPLVECEVCELTTDFVFVSDVSISIGDDAKYNIVRNFVAAISNFVTIGPNDNLVGKILFARHANISFHVQEHTNAEDLTAAINSIVYSDIPELDRTGTNIPEALDLLRTAGRPGGELRLRNHPNVTRVAVFITDGRPNTNNLTGNSRAEDAQNTEDAAARLHESGIYDQIYAIGIQGKKNINFRELGFIASDPSLVFVVQDFDAELFEELETNLTNLVCEQQQCTIEGQVYTDCAPPSYCHATCSDPFKVCPQTCTPGCVCPEGTVIDEIKNRCVPQSQCTCPPQCSDQYCALAEESDATLLPCMRGPPPYTEADCRDVCQLTYCEACYHSNDTLPTPPGCIEEVLTEKVCSGCLCCLREWTRCVEILNRRDNKCTGDCQTAENFQCYDYPPCIDATPAN